MPPWSGGSVACAHWTTPRRTEMCVATNLLRLSLRRYKDDYSFARRAALGYLGEK